MKYNDYNVIIILLRTITTLLYFGHVVNSYSPNPRAIHPDGKLPSKIQAKRRLPMVLNEVSVFRKKGCTSSRNNLILIDGNNIRNSFGYHQMSAMELTENLSTRFAAISSSGNDDVKQPEIICVWDGGKTRSSQEAPFASSTPLLIGFSGPHGNADDLIVQCCSFVSSSPSLAIDHCKVVIFTSDANLANRCKLQFMEEGTSCPIKIDLKIYHSIYLCLLLTNNKNDFTISHGSDVFVPDWERDERRRNVSELESFLEQTTQQHINNEIEHSIIQKISEWINGGLKDINVGRVTKGGSILYTYKETM